MARRPSVGDDDGGVRHRVALRAARAVEMPVPIGEAAQRGPSGWCRAYEASTAAASDRRSRAPGFDHRLATDRRIGAGIDRDVGCAIDAARGRGRRCRALSARASAQQRSGTPVAASGAPAGQSSGRRAARDVRAPRHPAVERVEDRATAGGDDRAGDLTRLRARPRARARGSAASPRAGSGRPGERPSFARSRSSRSTNGRPRRSATSRRPWSCRCRAARRGRSRQASAPSPSSRASARAIAASTGAGTAHRATARGCANPGRGARPHPRAPRSARRARLAHEPRRARPIDQVEHGEVGPQRAPATGVSSLSGADGRRVHQQVGVASSVGQARDATIAPRARTA